MKRPFAVIGGSGFIGRHVVARLVRHGIAVRLLTRCRESTKSLWVLPGLDVREVDMNDMQALSAALVGCDAVIHLAGIIRERKQQTFVRVHVMLPQTVVKACAAAGVSRLLHMSALNANPDGPSEYLRSKGDGEAVVRDSKLRWTIFQPSIVFGPGDAFLNMFARLLPHMPLLILPSVQTRFQPVYVGDVAEAFCHAALSTKTIGEIYPLGGPRVYRFDELLGWLGRTIGAPRPVIATPSFLAPLQAWLLEHAPGHVMTRDNLRSLRLDNVCEGEALSELGVTPTALEDSAPQWLPGRTQDRGILR